MKKYFSPGRINLIGEHIDYNGGNVFPCAIDLGITGVVTLNNSNTITMHSKNIANNSTVTINFEDEYIKTSTWADYLIGVLDVLRKSGYENKVGFNLEVDSNLPHGAGLSSSASIEVLMCVILNDLNNFNLSDEQIAVFAKDAENNFVGVNCGIMDQFIIANGIKDNALLLNTATLEFEPSKVNLNNNKIIIINSNKKRGLIDSAYNERRTECKTAEDIVKNNFKVNNLCDITVDQLESIKDQLDTNTYKRALHAVSEQERVKQAFDSLKQNKIEEFATCITKSHESMKNNFEASCDELDFIVETSLALNALGARMIGAGFGGCAIAIVDSEDLATFKQQLKTAYENKFPLTCDIYDVNIANKCMKLEDSDE